MHYVTKYNGSGNLFGDFEKIVDGLFKDTPVWNKSVPRVDVREEKDRYIIEAELPGVSEKNIEVKLEDNVLTLSGKENEDKVDKGENYLIRERQSNSFSRSFVLPKDVDRDKIEAKFANGVLTLEIEKRPEIKPRTIKIKAA